MECFILKKEDLHKFISYLKKRYEVIAPVQRDIIRYDVIKPNEQLQFVTPIYSVKKYFLPPKKTLSTFENNKIKSYCCDTKKKSYVPYKV